MNVLDYRKITTIGFDYNYNIYNNLSAGLHVQHINYNLNSFSDYRFAVSGFLINPEIKYFLNRKVYRQGLNIFMAAGLYYRNADIYCKELVPLNNSASIKEIYEAKTHENEWGISPRMGIEIFLGSSKRVGLELAWNNYIGYSIKKNTGHEYQFIHYHAQSEQKLVYSPGVKLGVNFLLFEVKRL